MSNHSSSSSSARSGSRRSLPWKALSEEEEEEEDDSGEANGERRVEEEVGVDVGVVTSRGTDRMQILKSRLSGLLEIRTQLVSACVASLAFLTSGLARAWASPGVPSMQADPHFALSYAPLSNEEVSWISSVTPLGALFGGLASSLPLSKLGRRLTLMLASALFAVSFAALGTSSLHEVYAVILMARAGMGAGVGLSLPAAQIYVSECSEPGVRGMLGSLPALFMAAGVVIGFAVGAAVPWNYLSYFCLAFPLALLCFGWALPESPSWLVSNGREEAARKALKWLRPEGKDVEKELTVLKDNVERQKREAAEAAEAEAAASAAGVDGLKQLSPLLQRPVLMPLFISMGLMLFQQWCGVNAIIFYTVSIFQAASSPPSPGGVAVHPSNVTDPTEVMSPGAVLPPSPSVIDENSATVVVGIVQFLATFVSIFLVDKAGRKMLLILSGLLMCLSLCGVGTFFHLRETGATVPVGAEFVPLSGLVLFMVGYSVGFASVPYVIMGELFPVKYRNLLGGISSWFNLTHTFLVIKLFTNLQTLCGGLAGVFWIYAGSSAAAVAFVALCLPETKGKTLEDIEAIFRKKNRQERAAGQA